MVSRRPKRHSRKPRKRNKNLLLKKRKRSNRAKRSRKPPRKRVRRRGPPSYKSKSKRPSRQTNRPCAISGKLSHRDQLSKKRVYGSHAYRWSVFAGFPVAMMLLRGDRPLDRDCARRLPSVLLDASSGRAPSPSSEASDRTTEPAAEPAAA